ncbi:hypothetical protein ACB094_11G165600 [Castanea mollissima]
MAVLMVGGAIRVLLDYVDSKEIKYFFLLHDYRFLEELKISLQFAAKVINNVEEQRDKETQVQDWLNDLEEAVYFTQDFMVDICNLLDSWGGGSRADKSKEHERRMIEQFKERMEIVLKRMEFILVYGREFDKRKIIYHLLSDNNASRKQLSVTWIVGMPGIGKTTLAGLVYHDHEVSQHFEFKAWLCFSEGFDMSWAKRAIIESMMCAWTIRLIRTGTSFYLILKFEDVASQICLIVTTGSFGFAAQKSINDSYVNMNPLSEKNGWPIISNNSYLELEAIRRKILWQCNGLPEVRTLAALLRCKPQVEEWKDVLERLECYNTNYDNLPTHLKACFAYCSIFPQGYGFEKEKLVLLWMAEGLLQQQGGNRTMEEVGDRYFNELVSRQFFQLSSGNKSRYVMHNLLNKLAVSMMKEICLRWKDDHLSISKRTWYLSLVGCYCLTTFLTLDYKDCHLRENELVRLFKVRLLRVLSLSHSYITELPNSSCKLEHLRYINLSHTTIKKLPESVCALRNLQTIILSNCQFLTMLPEEMWKLLNLRHLDISGTALSEMPKKWSTLKDLQTLSCLVVGKKSSSTIKELGGLQHLYGTLQLLELQNMVPSEDATKAGLKEKTYLDELLLKWGDDTKDRKKHRDVLEKLEPHTNLKRLNISFYSDVKFPDWLGNFSFSHMVSLLGQLPSLRVLIVEWMTAGMWEWEEWVSFEAEGREFPCLQELYIQGPLDELPCLKQLCIRRCPKLRGNLPKLRPSELVTALTTEASLNNLHYFEKIVFISDAKVTSFTSEGATGSSSLMIEELMALPTPLHSLKIEGCDVLRSIPDSVIKSPSLQHLYIINCCSLKSFPIGMALKILYIRNCKKLDFPLANENVHLDELEDLSVGSSCDSLTDLYLHLFPNLRSLSIWDCANLQKLSMPQKIQIELTSFEALEIRDCPNLEYFPIGGLPTPNLKSIWFSNCKSLKKLPDQLGLLKFLESMFINDCPELESLSKQVLPLKLSLLRINFCNKLIPGKEWGLHGLASLCLLEIEGGCKNVESFPVEGLLPSNLSSLRISKLSDLKKLDNTGLKKLESLKTLEISCCDKLQFLPEDGFPSSLSFLCIKDCPLLKPKLQNKNGEDWYKIACISCIEIDEEVMS